MKKLLNLLLRTLGFRLLWLADKIQDPSRSAKTALAERRTRSWYADPREATLLYDFPLDRNSQVLDVGGFEGNWALEMLARYGCRVEVFEPVPHFVERMNKRFAFTNRVVVHDFGLGGGESIAAIAVRGESSSFVHDAADTVPSVDARIRDVVGYLEEERLTQVDLLKVNIEGAEYELLERLLASGRADTFKFILVQFHDELPDAAERAATISAGLEQTHEIMWRFPFVWESWRRRERRTQYGAEDQ